MTAVNVLNVFVRYVLKSNIHWAMEFTVIAFAWLIFLGASWGVKIGAHIGVDTLINFFSDKIKKKYFNNCCYFLHYLWNIYLYWQL